MSYCTLSMEKEVYFQGCQPGSAWIQPWLTLILSQVIMQSNVNNVNPNRQHSCKVYYGHRLIETENPVLYLFVHGVQPQGHHALATKPQDLGCDRDLPQVSKGASCSAHPTVSGSWPLLAIFPSSSDHCHLFGKVAIFMAESGTARESVFPFSLTGIQLSV